MNIKIVKSSHKNKDQKWAIVYDCSEKNYRKRIKTGLYLSEKYFTNNEINIEEYSGKEISLKITLEKIRQKKDESLLKYEQNKWGYLDLEKFLEKGINIYSVEDYVKNILSESKNKITLNDYLNVVKVYKKYLSKNTLNFKQLLDVNTILLFKLNTQKGGLRSTSINSYLKKMGVIMNHAYKDGFVTEKFDYPKFLLEKREVKNKEINFCKNELAKCINSCSEIHQIQSISIFLLLLACGGMYPSSLMNYKLLTSKEEYSLINSILLDKKYDYIRFRKSKKGSVYRYVKINFRIKKLINIVKTLFLISHAKKYPFILESYSNENKIFDMDIYDESKIYKNIWNYFQRKLKEVSTVKFSDAKTIYFQYLSEIEMNRIVSDIMFGNINEKEVLALKNVTGYNEKIEKAEREVLNKIGVDEMTQIIINKLKLIGLDINNISFQNCKTPMEFSQLLEKINKYHKGL